MKWFFGIMVVLGFWLIFGGVHMVEMSHDWYGMMTGLAVSLIGLLTLFVSAIGSMICGRVE